MPFIADNELERALVQAAKNPGAAPDFYRRLLESDLLVLGSAEGQEDATDQFSVMPGGKLNLVTGLKDGHQYLPVFSSLARMQDYVKQESKYLRINGRALLELTRGAPVILNPASEYGKELTAVQVAQLLDPQPPRPLPMSVSEEEYPVALVEALRRAFAAHPDVETAWMIRIRPDSAQPPHPLVGIETHDMAGFRGLVEAIQDQTESLGMLFDVQRIDRAQPNSLTEALMRVPPFYVRGARQKLN